MPENQPDTHAMPEPMVAVIEPAETVVNEPIIVSSTTTKTVKTKPFELIEPLEKAEEQDKKDPVVVVDEAMLKTHNPLLKALGEENFIACQHYFDPLTDQQKKDVLAVFYQQLKAGTIKSKVRYFIGLAKKAQQDGLIVPKKRVAKKFPPQYSPEAFEVAKVADQEREERATLWSDYEWLKQQSIAQNKTQQELAELMNMEEAYALFSPMEQVAACAG